MKIFSALVCSVLLCLMSSAHAADDADEWEKSDPSVRGVQSSHWGFCSPSTSIEPTLAQWSEYASAIFIGTVEKTQFRFNKEDAISHRCWSHLNVKESLKGITDSDVWVEAYYDPYEKDGWKDQWNPENCYLKKGKTYLLFGKIINKENRKELPHYVEISRSDTDFCAPTLPIEEAEKEISMVRSILGNDGYATGHRYRGSGE